MSTGCAWQARPAARSPGSQLQQWGEMGEIFAAAVTLVETGDPDLVAPCVDFAEQHPESLRGLVGAIAWTEPERLGQLVRTWLDSEPPARALSRRRRLFGASGRPARAACAAGRGRGAAVRARALRLVGELGRADLAEPFCAPRMTDADATARFWASWSLALLTGSPRAVAELQRIALGFGARGRQGVRPRLARTAA